MRRSLGAPSRRNQSPDLSPYVDADNPTPLRRDRFQTVLWYLGHRGAVIGYVVLFVASAGAVAGVDLSRPRTTRSGPSSVALTVTCSTSASLTFTAGGAGAVTVRVSGARAASGSASVDVSGPAGSYTATATAGKGTASMSWTGPSSCHMS